MSHFVLVHGSFHGGWCWEQVVEHLESLGHQAVAPDLPGHGVDRTPLAACTLAAYVERVVQVIDAQPEPVVLVGHSMGGVVVTQAAEARPDRVRALVYLAAFAPQDGQSLLELAKTDAESQLLPELTFADGFHWPSERGMAEVFYHGEAAGQLATARARAVREPIAPVETPVRLTAAAYGRVSRVYVTCTADRALGPALQARMAAAAGARLVARPWGHMAMAEAPADLAALLAAT